MQVKMCVLGGILVCFLVVCICVLSLCVYGVGNDTATLSWGNLTAIETSQNQYTLPIYIHGIPPEGFCGLLFWVDIEGDATIQEITWGDLGDHLHPTYHIENTPNASILGILLDSTTNSTPKNPLLCTLTLTLNPTQTYHISLICEGLVALDEQNQVITLPVSLPSPTEITLSPQETDNAPPQETIEDITVQETTNETTEEYLPSAKPTPPTTLPLTVNGVFVGVQDTLLPTQNKDTTTYAVRFLFMIDTTTPPPQNFGCVVCLSGGGVVRLSCETKTSILSVQGSEQVTLTPTTHHTLWLTYTYAGLSTQENYTFEVYHSQGVTHVTYQNGIYGMVR